MKNALILHGTGNTSRGNWFPWLSEELQKAGYVVWTPDLPRADEPDEKRYLDYLFANVAWQYTSESIIIGHSSGGVAALKLVQNLPQGIIIDRCFTIGAFTNTHGWDDIAGLLIKPFDFSEIKKHARKFIVFHSDDDPYVPLDDAKELEEGLSAELVLIPGQGHFNLEKGEQYRQFPELLEKIVR